MRPLLRTPDRSHPRVISVALFLFCLPIAGQPLLAQVSPPATEWTTVYGTPEYENDGELAIDSNRNLFAVGSTLGSYPGQTSAGNTDATLVKFDSRGRQLWVRQWGGDQSDVAVGVDTDVFGNAYVTGWFLDSTTNANAGFLRKFNASGDCCWSHKFIVAVGASGDDVTVWRNRFVYVCGLAGRPSLPGGNSFGFISKYDVLGRHYWTKTIGDPRPGALVHPSSLVTDAVGNIYVTGATYDTLNGQPVVKWGDAFVVKYDTSGRECWTRTWGTDADEWTRGICLDCAGNIYLTGGARKWSNPARQPPVDRDDRTQLEALRTESQDYWAFVVQLDSQGTFQWESRINRTDDAINVAADRCGRLYLSGFGFAARMSGSPAQLDWKIRAPAFNHGLVLDPAGAVYLHGDTEVPWNGQPLIGKRDGVLIKLSQTP
ncbi:MAG: SBBP repeat-containing protein [Planctomycetota bacterium]